MTNVLLIVLAIVVVISVYFYSFFLRILPLFRIERSRRLCKILAVALTAVCILVATGLRGIGSILVLFLLVSCVVVDCLNYFFNRFLKKKTHKQIWRYIHCNGMLAFIIATSSFGYGYKNAKDVTITNYQIESYKKSDQTGMKIAMIADLHMGTTMNAENLEKYCKQIDESNPDVVFLVGDIFDESTTKEEMVAASKLLGEIDSTYGTYYVFGNHEVGSQGVERAFNKEEIKSNLTAGGITVLEDESVLIDDSFYIAGRKDASVERENIGELLGGLDMSKFIIVLDHQPKEITLTAEAGADLQLSGHTHGGQLWPIGPLSEIFDINELSYGYEKVKEKDVIVTSGIGSWGYPVRTGSTEEIVMIDMEYN